MTKFEKLMAFILRKKIKGNVNIAGNKIYYEPSHRLYKTVIAETMFRTVKEARKAGYRAPLK